MPEIVQMAGGREDLAMGGKESRRVEWREVTRFAPGVLLLMPCGFSLERTVREWRRSPKRITWRPVEMYAVDGPSYFNGAGPRWVDGLELLAALLHPDIVRRGCVRDGSVKMGVWDA